MTDDITESTIRTRLAKLEAGLDHARNTERAIELWKAGRIEFRWSNDGELLEIRRTEAH